MSNPNPPNQFEPGNKYGKGRPPKGYSITELVKEMFEKQPELRSAFVATILEKAMKKRDVTAMKMIWQYMDGMPQQKVDVTSNGEQVGSISTETMEKIEGMYAKQSIDGAGAEPVRQDSPNPVAEAPLQQTP